MVFISGLQEESSPASENDESTGLIGWSNLAIFFVATFLALTLFFLLLLDLRRYLREDIQTRLKTTPLCKQDGGKDVVNINGREIEESDNLGEIDCALCNLTSQHKLKLEISSANTIYGKNSCYSRLLRREYLMYRKYFSVKRIYFLRKSYFKSNQGNFLPRETYNNYFPYSPSDDESGSTFDYDVSDDEDDDTLKDSIRWKNTESMNDQYYFNKGPLSYMYTSTYDQDHTNPESSFNHEEMKEEMEINYNPSRQQNSSNSFLTNNFIGTPSPDSPANRMRSYWRRWYQWCVDTSFFFCRETKRSSFSSYPNQYTNNLSRSQAYGCSGCKCNEIIFTWNLWKIYWSAIYYGFQYSYLAVFTQLYKWCHESIVVFPGFSKLKATTIPTVICIHRNRFYWYLIYYLILSLPYNTLLLLQLVCLSPPPEFTSSTWMSNLSSAILGLSTTGKELFLALYFVASVAEMMAYLSVIYLWTFLFPDGKMKRIIPVLLRLTLGLAVATSLVQYLRATNVIPNYVTILELSCLGNLTLSLDVCLMGVYIFFNMTTCIIFLYVGYRLQKQVLQLVFTYQEQAEQRQANERKHILHQAQKNQQFGLNTISSAYKNSQNQDTHLVSILEEGGELNSQNLATSSSDSCHSKPTKSTYTANHSISCSVCLSISRVSLIALSCGIAFLLHALGNILVFSLHININENEDNSKAWTENLITNNDAWSTFLLSTEGIIGTIGIQLGNYVPSLLVYTFLRLSPPTTINTKNEEVKEELTSNVSLQQKQKIKRNRSFYYLLIQRPCKKTWNLAKDFVIKISQSIIQVVGQITKCFLFILGIISKKVSKPAKRSNSTINTETSDRNVQTENEKQIKYTIPKKLLQEQQYYYKQKPWAQKSALSVSLLSQDSRDSLENIEKEIYNQMNERQRHGETSFFNVNTSSSNRDSFSSYSSSEGSEGDEDDHIIDRKQFKNEVVWNTIPLHAEERSMSQGLEQSDHTFHGLGRSSASNFQKYSKKAFFSSFSPRSSLLGDETEKENTRIENSSLSANSKVLGEKKAGSLSTLGNNRKALGEKI